jgi:hypothetical protein
MPATMSASAGVLLALKATVKPPLPSGCQVTCGTAWSPKLVKVKVKADRPRGAVWNVPASGRPPSCSAA